MKKRERRKVVFFFFFFFTPWKPRRISDSTAEEGEEEIEAGGFGEEGWGELIWNEKIN